MLSLGVLLNMTYSTSMIHRETQRFFHTSFCRGAQCLRQPSGRHRNLERVKGGPQPKTSRRKLDLLSFSPHKTPGVPRARVIIAPKYVQGQSTAIDISRRASKTQQSSNNQSHTSEQSTSRSLRVGGTLSNVHKTPRAEKPLPQDFTSPPLSPALLASLHEARVLGPSATPTVIQSLALAHMVSKLHNLREPRQWCIAAETGSGKTLAYMLPLLQWLKMTDEPPPHSSTNVEVQRPRAIILAPSHELVRQLSTVAKSLSHQPGGKLRVVCASKANTPGRGSSKPEFGLNKGMTPIGMKRIVTSDQESGEFTIKRGDTFMDTPGDLPVSTSPTRSLDVLVATPMKLLEMLFGRYWDKQDSQFTYPSDTTSKLSKAREPEIALDRVGWLVIDEADVLFDPDFLRYTQLIMSSIAKARDGYDPKPNLPAIFDSGKKDLPPLPFNLTLATATLPHHLSHYLATYHPRVVTLASPNLHKLPSRTKVEYVYSKETGSGNINVAVEAKLKEILPSDQSDEDTKVVMFCNRNTKVEELSEWLQGRGWNGQVVAVTSWTRKDGARKWGSNRHIQTFLTTPVQSIPPPSESMAVVVRDMEQPKPIRPRILITTSLLSRGLDFSKDVRHVFLLQPPRNEVDFLHRAGRTARAGRSGVVVVFQKGKYTGRQPRQQRLYRK